MTVLERTLFHSTVARIFARIFARILARILARIFVLLNQAPKNRDLQGLLTGCAFWVPVPPSQSSSSVARYGEHAESTTYC